VIVRIKKYGWGVGTDIFIGKKFLCGYITNYTLAKSELDSNSLSVSSFSHTLSRLKGGEDYFTSKKEFFYFKRWRNER
jgi:hypothetical protein